MSFQFLLLGEEATSLKYPPTSIRAFRSSTLFNARLERLGLIKVMLNGTTRNNNFPRIKRCAEKLSRCCRFLIVVQKLATFCRNKKSLKVVIARHVTQDKRAAEHLVRGKFLLPVVPFNITIRLNKTSNKSPSQIYVYGNYVRAETACHALRSMAGLPGFLN